MTAQQLIQQRIEALAKELPGVTFGYIGNVGVDRSGAYDDRIWCIFLPHPGRVGLFQDRVDLGDTTQLEDAVGKLDASIARARIQYNNGTVRVL